jgi:hypothetical protein
MAILRNITLTVGRLPSGDEFAEVFYDVDFGDVEISHDFWYGEQIYLMERDEGADIISRHVGARADGSNLLADPKGDPDGMIGPVFNRRSSFRPAGRRTVRRSHRREWAFPRNESGPEEYRALVVVTPEIWQDSAWSDKVTMNLA